MAGQVVECIACGHVGVAGKKGSTGVLLLLLMIFFPVGILYWLSNRGGGVCSACKSNNIKLYIPQAKIRQQQPQTQQLTQQSNVQQVQCPDCREYIRYDARKCKHCGTMIS